MVIPAPAKSSTSSLTPKQEAKAAYDALARGEFSAAVEIYKRLLEAYPDNDVFWSNLGTAQRSLKHREAALGCAKRAVELDPSQPNYLINLGNAFADLNRMDEAITAFAKAVQMEPKNIGFRQKYASALRQYDKFDEALKQIAIAIGDDPNNVELRWQRAIANLTLGNFHAGWKDYEARWERDQKKPSYGAQEWNGEDLKGKTIFLYEEQGFGDTILGARYIPLVKQRGARVIFGCRAPLHRLFRDTPGIDLLIEGGSHAIDYHAPLMNLPRIFNTELKTILPPAKLTPAEKLPEGAAPLLALGKGRVKVGIIWSGNPEFPVNFKRAVTFSRMLPLAEIPGVQLYSLQMGAPEKELAESGAKGLVLDLTPYLKDFADTAAVLQELDLVIMTDSSVAHLAGSLGRPVWNLLDFSPYWLYLHKREDSPWYPSMRLFRQPQPGDWDSVFEKVTAELTKSIGSRP